MTPEFRLLAFAVKRPLAADGAGEPGARTVDWPLLLSLARRHRVMPLVADFFLNRDGRNALVRRPPEDILNLLRREQTFAAVKDLATISELERLLAAFRERGLDPVLLKGLAVAQEAFGRPGLRTDRDIDMLVSDHEVDAAERALVALDYIRAEPATGVDRERLRDWRRRRKDFVFVSPERGMLVELHWRLFDNRRLMALDPGASQAKMNLFGRVECRVLPPDDNFVYLCCHGALHAWSRLKWLADIEALSAGRNHEVRQSRREAAQKWGALASYSLAMALRRAVFEPDGAPLPDETAYSVRMLKVIALKTMIDSGQNEIEDLRFGATLKNVGHYLLSASPAYWAEELRFDLLEKFDPRLRKPASRPASQTRTA